MIIFSLLPQIINAPTKKPIVDDPASPINIFAGGKLNNKKPNEAALIDKHKIKLTDTMEDIESWDSIGQLQLIMNIEAEFGIKLNTEDVVQIDSVEKCIGIVNKLLVE